MSLPATRLAMPHVGTAGNQGSQSPPCSDRPLRQQPPGRRMIIVLDNARYHHAILLAAFLRRNVRHLRLLFLPPYSPQLAPIERVWKLTRRLATHNRYFATLPEGLTAVNACFDPWRRSNDVLRRLCCIT